MADREDPLERACGEVARAVFPHVTELRHRREVEVALFDLIGAIVERYESAIAAFEARVAGLEKDSHPPVPLRPIVIEEVMAAMKRTVQRPRLGGDSSSRAPSKPTGGDSSCSPPSKPTGGE